MKLFNVTIYFLIILMSTPIYSSEESESYPEFYQLDFQKNATGIVFENGARPRVMSDHPVLIYAELINNQIKILTKNAFKKRFLNVKMVNESPVNYYETHQVIDQNGVKYKVNYSACVVSNETDDICNKLTIEVDKKLIDIDLKATKVCDGCRVIALARWNDKLWMSFSFRGEYGPQGHGVHILEIKTKKLVSPIQDGPSLVSIIRKDPRGEVMWIGGNNGLYGYNSEFKLVHSCKIFYPFWNKSNNDLKLKHNDFNFSCDK